MYLIDSIKYIRIGSNLLSGRQPSARSALMRWSTFQ